MKKKLLPFFIALLSLIVFVSFPKKVFAESADEILRDREAERIERLVSEIKLVIPDITSEPSPVITFTPVKGDTVELQINGKGFNAVQSPYQFEGLSIGKYVLDFKYVDGSDITQTFTKNLIIVPREARTQNQKLLFKDGEEVVVSGTALPFSGLDMWVISSGEILFKTTPVDKDGNWSINISEGLACGDYKILTMVKKDGFSSTMSTALNISYCTENKTAVIAQGEEIDELTFSERINRIIDDIKSNDDSIIIASTALFTGLIIGIFYSIIRVRGMKANVKKMLEGKLTKFGYTKSDEKDSSDLGDNVYPVKTKYDKAEKEKSPVQVPLQNEGSEDNLPVVQDLVVGESKSEEQELKLEDDALEEPKLPADVNLDLQDKDGDEEIMSELVVEPASEEVDTEDQIKGGGNKRAAKKIFFFGGFKKKAKPKKEDPVNNQEVEDNVKTEEEVVEVKDSKKVKKSAQKSKSFSRDEFLSKFQELEKKRKSPQITLTSSSDSDVFTDD